MKVEAVCPFCACLCDDITVVVEDGTIKGIRNACRLGVEKFLSAGRERKRRPVVRGQESDYARAVEEAVKILRKADKPLIYGLSNTGCAAQSRALKIARKLGGICDTTESICHNLVWMELMHSSFFYPLLDEIREKADTIIFWGCNPVHSHPRHLSKFSVYPTGRYAEKGVMDREVITVDVVKNELDKVSSWFLRVSPGKDHIICEFLEGIIKGRGGAVRKDLLSHADADLSTLTKIADRMKRASYGVIFLGLGITSSADAPENIKAIFSLVKTLNEFTRFFIFPMKGHFNIVGATETLLREAGYPFGVDFSGENIFEPGKTTVLDALDRVDAALIVGADPFVSFPSDKVEKLRKIPLIVLDPFETVTSKTADIYFPVAISGVEAEEIAYRMDGVAIKLKKIIRTDIPSDSEILEKIYNGL